MLPGTYLIAGSTGLMGTTALLRMRNTRGVKIKAVYHLRQPRIFGDNISYIKADLRHPDDCKKVVEGIDYVFMFSAVLSTAPVIAKNPVSHITSNMIMNAQMLEAAYFAGVKKFLWLSSSTGYPLTEQILKEEDMFKGDPPDVYFSVGWMTRYTEVLCRMYATKLKNPMPTIILRPTTIYGEYESFDLENAHVLPALVRKVVDRQDPIEVWGTVEDMRDLIYADDVFDACILALEQVDRFDVFNIGYGEQYSVNELLKMILNIDNYGNAKVIHNISKPTTIQKRMIDLKRSREVLGFKPKTSLEEGIKRMIAFYRNNRLVI